MRKISFLFYQCRKNFNFLPKELPIVVAGNKVDLADESREIFVEDVIDWVAYSLPTKR
jgi:hypothetical protein